MRHIHDIAFVKKKNTAILIALDIYEREQIVCHGKGTQFNSLESSLHPLHNLYS
jgi:hypothetical protein